MTTYMKNIYQTHAHGKEMEGMCEAKRYEGVSKALDMLGHATYQICPIFSQRKRYFLTHIYIKDASLKV
jgi:hypothetical protein